MAAIDLDSIFYEINKKSHLGVPAELNYGAMIVSVFARYIERIPTIKDLVKRLNHDLSFKLDCGFKVSEPIPSEASYSRLLPKLSETSILEKVQETMIVAAISEGFITDDTVAIDSTHFEARDKAPAKEEKPKAEPKKRGRKKKEEREKWLAEQAEREANLPLYEKKMEDQLDVPLSQLRTEIPQDPKWGVKKNSEGQNVFWFGYKGHRSIIAYNKRNEPQPIGFTEHFAPTCVREYSYRYDSYDAKYETLKYTHPK